MTATESDVDFTWQRPVTAAYVHVPFCIHRCGYCDFTVIAGRDDLMSVYLDCLEQDLQQVLGTPQEVKTLFLGGGTPNYLPPDELARLLQLLQYWLPVQDTGEYSIECNPEKFTDQQMELLQAGGVNRVSLGVQSFQAEHLQTLERSHSPASVMDVVERLRRHGFQNVSFDLIYAVPEQTLADWRKTLEVAVSLQPEHLSTYGLTYEKGTSFWTRRLKSELTPAEEELEREMYGTAIEVLQQRGYEQYELSNYARPGYQCRHNQVYWNSEPYYGFGPGAAAYLNGVRSTRTRSVTRWIRQIQQAESGIAEEENMTLDLARREAVMLGLRQISGIDLDRFAARFKSTVRDLSPDAHDQFIATGLLEVAEGSLRLTHEGRFVADSVVVEFL